MSVVNGEVMNRPFCRDITKACECVCATESNDVGLKNAKALTLEELRKMDGKPAFGVSLITDKPGEWFICRVVEMSKVWFIACAGASQGFGDKDTYGKTWLAYAAEPPRLDRSAWKCGICEVPTHWVEWGNLGYEYCPHCGRPLTDSAWDMLERRIVTHDKR